MKKLFLLLLWAVVTLNLWAVPANRQWRTMSQPDGTTITLRLVGDELYHYWQNQEGQRVIQDANGYWQVDATSNTPSEIAQRRKSSPMYAAVAARANQQPCMRKAAGTAGNSNRLKNLLVILVNFSDKTMQSKYNNTFFTNLLNQENYGKSGSVRDYFIASSEGAYEPTFDVYGPVTLDRPQSYYGGNDKYGDDNDPAQMIVDACAKAEAAGCDFSKYDCDNDGYVDNVYVIYAGYSEAAGGAANCVWPHSWNLSSAGKAKPRYDGVYVNEYACSAELSGSKGTNSDGVGTFAHEFSHTIGLPDYYDTEYDCNEDKTPGEWTLMDQGSYNDGGQTPPLWSIYDKYFMGWVSAPAVLTTEPDNVTMGVGSQYARQINSSNTVAAATKTSVVYYLENRQKTGFDASLPGAGLVVWKVKYNANYWAYNEVNSCGSGCTYNKSGEMCYVLEGGKAKTSGSYTPITGYALTNINVSGGNVNFSYNGGVSCHSVEVNETNCSIQTSTGCAGNGTAITATITPKDATYRMTSVSISRGATDITTNCTISGDKKSVTIPAAQVSGNASDNIMITAVATKTSCSYGALQDPDGCTISSEEGTVSNNAQLQLTITPKTGYALDNAACWEVWMGNTELAFGTDFTYANNTFTISHVTDDVEIYIYPGYAIYWYANNDLFATTTVVKDAKLALPTTSPEACVNGDEFVGWTATEGYSNTTTAPSFVSDGAVVSGTKNYYAVFATKTSGEGSKTVKFIFSDIASEKNWSDGVQYGTVAVGGVTASTSNPGTNDGKYYTSDDSWRMYSCSLVLTSDDGAITAVESTPSVSWVISNGEATYHFASKTKLTSITVTLGNAATYENYSTICSSEIHKKNPTSSFATTSKNMTVGQTFTQTVTTNADGTVSYSSSNTDVATVNQTTGEVTAVGAGQTTITATIADGICYNDDEVSYSVNVSKNSVNASFTETQEDFEYGTVTSFQHIVTTSSDGAVTYSSSNTAVATVTNDGTVTIHKPGTVTITANVAATKSVDAGEASYTFTVTKHPVEASFQQSAYTMPKDADNFIPVFTHNSANDASVTFSSSNTAAATINAATGEVDVLEIGQTTITATVAATDYYEGATATCTIDVVKAADKVTVTFMVNGVAVQTGQQAVGLPLALPANPKYPHFAGWTAQGNYFNLTDKPADLFTAQDGKTVPGQAVTYYAVFHVQP